MSIIQIPFQYHTYWFLNIRIEFISESAIVCQIVEPCVSQLLQLYASVVIVLFGHMPRLGAVV